MQEVARGNLTSPCGIEAPLWCQSLTTKHSNAQAPTSTITDSQSSVFGKISVAPMPFEAKLRPHQLLITELFNCAMYSYELNFIALSLVMPFSCAFLWPKVWQLFCLLVGSLMSVSKPKVGNKLGREVKSDGFLEQSDDDDDDGEIEPGLCEQSANPNGKHSRRYVLRFP